jgi:cobalt-zinc-cadmium efflux system protein
MAHDEHDHAGHEHSISSNADRRYLMIALGLLVGFMVVEVVIGLLAGSLALIADAGHMLTDAGALGLALISTRLAERPSEGNLTFGLKRVEILSLLLLAAWFVYEGISRLITPPRVEGGLVLIVAVVGIAVNLYAAWIIAKANRRSLNVESAYQHILTDLYAFIATAIAGLIIWLTGYNRVDAVAALIVAAIMLRAGYRLVKDTWRIFLEAAPKGLSPEEIGYAMAAHPDVTEVHDLHVWEVTSDFPALSAHVLVGANSDCHGRRRELEQLLETRFDIKHTTLQVDYDQHEAWVSVEDLRHNSSNRHGIFLNKGQR